MARPSAGVPAPVLKRAKSVLEKLEKGRAATGGLAAGLDDLPLFAAAIEAEALLIGGGQFKRLGAGLHTRRYLRRLGADQGLDDAERFGQRLVMRLSEALEGRMVVVGGSSLCAARAMAPLWLALPR